jgi:negative regulator of flagellin synthesis FlgM
MQIHGLGHVHGAQPLQGPQRSQVTHAATQPDTWSGVDEVDISPEADVVSRVHDVSDIRSERVAEIRAQIADGVYETEERLEVAVGRLLDELAG